MMRPPPTGCSCSIIAFAISLLAAPVSAQASPFACDEPILFSKEFKNFVAKHGGQKKQSLLKLHTDIWYSQESARRCEAHKRGETVRLSCMIKEIDFDAVLKSIPDGVLVGSRELRIAHLKKMRATNARRKASYLMNNACIKAGLRRGKLKDIE